MMFNKVYLGATPISKIFLGDVPIKYGNNIVAIYTVNDINKASPTLVVGKADDWKETVVDNGDNTYTVTITASRGPTKISFENNTSLLSVDYLNYRNITDMSDMFYNCTNLQTLHLDNWSYDSIGMIINVSSLPINDIGTIKSIHCKKEEADGLIAPENWEFSYPYNTIAIYTVDDKQKTSPTYIVGKADDWEEIVKDNGDGTYTVTITASYGPTKISFEHEPKNIYDNSALLTVDYIDTSNITSMHYMFFQCESLTSINTRNWNTSQVTNMSSMFSRCKNLTSLYVSNFDTGNVTDIQYMFYGCEKLESLDASNWDISKVTDMEYMFCDCKSLTSIGDVSNWDTSQVTDMYNMFYDCNNLSSLDTSNWNTSQVTSMGGMFYKCWGLTSLDLSKFDTSKVGNMSGMFRYCYGIESLDLSGWDTGKVGNMSNMFEYCNKLTTIGDVSNWDTGNVINMNYMFSHCGKLESLDLSSWITSQVTEMVYMFGDCRSLTSLSLSIFDTSNVTNMNHMLYNCDKLREIHLDNCSNSNIRKIITSSGFPTNVITGVTRTIYCKKENAAGLTIPTSWVFSYVS